MYEEGRAHDISLTGVEAIGSKNGVNWHKIRAEYIGGASQRSLAEKYGIPFTTVQKRCQREKWSEDRQNAKIKITENVVNKTSELAADNATIAAGIKRKALMILDRLLDDYQFRSTEHQEFGPGSKDISRLRDLTAAYKDLTGDLTVSNNSTNELLQSLIDLERGLHD